jgi:hypothetical protein
VWRVCVSTVDDNSDSSADDGVNRAVMKLWEVGVNVKLNEFIKASM